LLPSVTSNKALTFFSHHHVNVDPRYILALALLPICYLTLAELYFRKMEVQRRCENIEAAERRSSALGLDHWL